MMEASMHLGTHGSCRVMLVVLSALGRFNYQSQPPQLVKAMDDSPMPPPPFMAKSSPSPDTSGSTVSTTSAIAQATLETTTGGELRVRHGMPLHRCTSEDLAESEESVLRIERLRREACAEHAMRAALARTVVVNGFVRKRGEATRERLSIHYHNDLLLFTSNNVFALQREKKELLVSSSSAPVKMSPRSFPTSIIRHILNRLVHMRAGLVGPDGCCAQRDAKDVACRAWFDSGFLLCCGHSV
jgi:hypothetical protein